MSFPLDIASRHGSQLLRQLDADHPSKRELQGSGKNSLTLPAPEVEKDVPRSNAQSPQRPPKTRPARRHVPDALLVMQPQVFKVHVARQVDAVAPLQDGIGESL